MQRRQCHHRIRTQQEDNEGQRDRKVAYEWTVVMRSFVIQAEYSGNSDRISGVNKGHYFNTTFQNYQSPKSLLAYKESFRRLLLMDSALEFCADTMLLSVPARVFSSYSLLFSRIC